MLGPASFLHRYAPAYCVGYQTALLHFLLKSTMCDPFSIAGSAVGVVSLGFTVCAGISGVLRALESI
ncbi:hypothetical protein BJX96DRAFT_145166 [Aspergillus floccosus]